MQLLITTMTDDLHAEAVALALQQRGHQVTRVHGADFPQRQCASLALEADDLQLKQHGAALAGFDPGAVDVVWNRRRQWPHLPPTTHVDDVDFAWRENHVFADAIWRLSGSAAFWVNPEDNARAAELKPYQLRQALALGLRIPPTLMSNDPARIREFIHSHAGECIYKPLTYGDWQETDGARVLYAAGIDAAELPQDSTLQACPGIFQRRIAKQFEVRATFMGAQCMALRLESQHTVRGHLDWRRAQGSELIPALPISLPEAIERKCRALMQRLGLVFGCFDFIVDADGDWVFLEVNQMGQFLFLEAWCPQLPVLDAFCAFLVSRDPDFRYTEPADPVRFAELRRSGALSRRVEQARADHLPASAQRLATVAAG